MSTARGLSTSTLVFEYTCFGHCSSVNTLHRLLKTSLELIGTMEPGGTEDWVQPQQHRERCNIHKPIFSLSLTASSIYNSH